MKLLIINNQTKYISQLVNCFNDYDIEVVSIFNLDSINLDSFDAYILSGSSKYPVKYSLDIYSKELSLIKESKKPILGICLGFELICHAFNEELVFHDKRIAGVTEITFNSKDKIFKDLASPLKVYESHRWSIPRTEYLKTLATSNTGVEIVKHPTKKIYGLQFHPELKLDKQKILIKNFLKLLN